MRYPEHLKFLAHNRYLISMCWQRETVKEEGRDCGKKDFFKNGNVWTPEISAGSILLNIVVSDGKKVSTILKFSAKLSV